MTRGLFLGFTLVLVGGSGCGELDPDVGPRRAASCRNEDGNPVRRVSFREDVQPIFRGEDGPVGCRCHLPSEPDPIGFEIGGLDLSTFSSLLAGGTNSGSDIVVPGEPCRSILFLKMGPTPPFGSRMPFDGPPVLDPARRQLIADWIAEGADDN